MTRRLLLVLLWGLLVGCAPSSDAEPPLEDSLMVEVLMELHLAGARAQMELDASSALRDTIFERHGIQEQDLQAAMRYYSDRPERYIRIYERVLNRLHEERRLPPGPEEEAPGSNAQM